MKSKILKIFLLLYVSAFTFFLIIQSVEYFSKDRAYPQAKAYKIVADVSAFYFDLFIANRDLYFKPSGLKYIQPYEKWQNFLMHKAFKYISKEDAERAIWKYEYFYANYVRAMAAPIDFKKLHKDDLKYILKIGGHTTIYKPQAKKMLIEIEHLLDILMNNPIQDKQYNNVQRYMTTVLFSEWWQKFSFLHYTLGARTVDEEQGKEYIEIQNQWMDDTEYLNMLKKLSSWLDVTKDKIDNSKALQKMIKEHKLIYPDLMGLRVYFRAELAYATAFRHPLSCKMSDLQEYLKIRMEFLKYVDQDNIFKKLNWRERNIVDKSVVTGPNAILEHILYKNCQIEKNYLSYKFGINSIQKSIFSAKKWDFEKKYFKEQIK